MPSTVQHQRDRDPLTVRYARTVRETTRDPYDYSEGATEPQLVDVAKSFPHAARMRRAFGLGNGCYGNCNQGRRPCTMPGVCGRGRIAPHALAAMADGNEHDTMPGFPPAPAEACTDVGHQRDNTDRADERRRMQLIAALVIGVLCVVVAFAFKALVGR